MGSHGFGQRTGVSRALKMPSLFRRLTATFASVMMLLVTTGIPLPLNLDPAKSDEDFPCRYHACGCLSAAMCRTKCGCFRPRVTETKEVSRTTCGCAKPQAIGSTALDESASNGGRPTGLIIGALGCQGVDSSLMGGVLLFLDRPTNSLMGLSEPIAVILLISDRLPELHDPEPVVPPPRPC